jgi:subtilase family serine protease
MKTCTSPARLRLRLAVLLAAAGLHGCGAPDAGDSDASADDQFRPAHVLGSGQALPENASSVASADSREWYPLQFRTAYNVPLTQSNKPAGYGIKIAVIAAYHSANLQYDLNKWAARFSITPIALNIINQAGTATNSTWALETAVNVQMINAVSPGATVYVIEAKSVSHADIRTAMLTAQNFDVDIITMSFCANEPATQAFAFAPSRGVWIAPSGDAGRPSFPATHASVVAVGGTVAQLSASNTIVAETAWVHAGAGMSTVAALPSFQRIPSVQALNTTSYRSVPDVAFHANPDSGAAIYSSINGGWLLVGGTTVPMALFAGVVAMADQSRKSQNKPLLTSVSGSGVTLQDTLYKLVSTNGGPTVLNDVTTGSAGEGGYAAGLGYDVATGLGSLNVQHFIDYVAAQ